MDTYVQPDSVQDRSVTGKYRALDEVGTFARPVVTYRITRWDHRPRCRLLCCFLSEHMVLTPGSERGSMYAIFTIPVIFDAYVIYNEVSSLLMAGDPTSLPSPSAPPFAFPSLSQH